MVNIFKQHEKRNVLLWELTTSTKLTYWTNFLFLDATLRSIWQNSGWNIPEEIAPQPNLCLSIIALDINSDEYGRPFPFTFIQKRRLRRSIRDDQISVNRVVQTLAPIRRQKNVCLFRYFFKYLLFGINYLLSGINLSWKHIYLLPHSTN